MPCFKCLLMTVRVCNTANLHSSGAAFFGETKSREDYLRSLSESTPLLGSKTPGSESVHSRW